MGKRGRRMESPTRTRVSVLDLARRGISRCQKKLRTLTRKSRPSPVDLCDDVLEAIFSKMPVEERLRMVTVSKRTTKIVERMPLMLDFVMIRSDGRGNYELHSDHIDLILGYILDACSGYRVTSSDTILFNERVASDIIGRILSRIAGVRQLWLESSSNDLIAEIIVDYYRTLHEHGCHKRFQLEQLTLVGDDTKIEDMRAVASLIHLSSDFIDTIRIRQIRMPSEERSSSLWAAVGCCQNLQQLQYEPCRLDKFSRPHIIQALAKKQLTSLIMTGVADLQSQDVHRIASSSSLTELAVVGTNISPFTYCDSKGKHILERLGSLLLQIESGFNLDDVKPRNAILQILLTLPNTSKLEVIHVNRGTVADTTRVISYWLHLAKEANRVVKLKLEECSQERQDAAVGRLLRKSRDSNKIDWTMKGITLSCGTGKVILLDKQTWFGDEDE